jgi:hypothetical protein
MPNAECSKLLKFMFRITTDDPLIFVPPKKAGSVEASAGRMDATSNDGRVGGL